MADDPPKPLDTATAGPETVTPQAKPPAGEPAKKAVLERAYRDELFLRTPEARPLRILAEYLEPLRRFNRYRVEDTIVFFGSARIMSREANEKALADAKAAGEDLGPYESRLALSQYYEKTRELARRLTEWSKALGEGERRFVVCSGGGPGIMEAANRGASEARGLNIGLNIALPFEQQENPYTTRELAFNFHYFFMRKFWFAYLAKAMVIMPGGFGTFDELFEILTLVQTRKIRKKLPIVLLGKSFWDEVVNFDALVRHGTISPEDLSLFLRTDSVDEAFEYITRQLTKYALHEPGPSL